MRAVLGNYVGQRRRFYGTFARCGTKRGWGGRIDQTVLLVNIVDDAGTPVADHLWVPLTHTLARLGLVPEDVLAFDACVAVYRKGYQDGHKTRDMPVTWDYKLLRLTRIVKVIPAFAEEHNKGEIGDSTVHCRNIE